MYDIKTLCKAVKLNHSVYYYHKTNKENSYKKENEELDKKSNKNMKNPKNIE